jgi:hypothetical protein
MELVRSFAQKGAPLRQAERERRGEQSASTHPNISERPRGTLPTIDEKPPTTVSRKTNDPIRSLGWKNPQK